MWDINLIKIQQYYEKTGHAKGRSHMRGESIKQGS
jgi:hypothetical protein